MILCETRGLQLFCTRCIGLNRRLGAEAQHTERLTNYYILSLEPERRKNRLATTGHENLGITWVCLRRSSCLRFQLVCVETGSLETSAICLRSWEVVLILLGSNQSKSQSFGLVL